MKERVIEVCPSASNRDELDAIVETVRTCCPEFIKLATKAFAPKRKFLAPPSFVCHECSGVLMANNPPSNICYYGLEGAIPGLKVDLYDAADVRSIMGIPLMATPRMDTDITSLCERM